MTDLFSDKQEAFLRKPLKRINLLYGSVRSGKTWISLLKWALWIGEQPKTNEFLMVGKTITALKRNCFGYLEKQIGASNFQYSLSQKTAYIFGRKIWLEGANDERSESKIRGMTLKGAYIDELTQIPESFYFMVLSRLSVAGAALIATTNPDRPDHYVNEKIIQNDDLDKRVWKFLIDENIKLDEDYKKNLKKEYTGIYYKRFILGEFVRAEGVIFPDFADKPEPYILPFDELYIDKTRKEKGLRRFRWCEVGFDIGGNGSAYALTCTAEGYDENYYVLQSTKIQPQDINIQDIEKIVDSFCKGVEQKYHIKIDIINSDHIDAIINSINDHTTYRCDKTYKPALEDRPFVMARLLATHRIYFIEDMCDDLIDELQNLVYDDSSERAIPLDDGTMQIDTWDSWTYSVSGHWGYINT